MISKLNKIISSRNINRPINNNEKKVIELLHTKYSFAYESFISGSVLYRGIRQISPNDNITSVIEYRPVKRIATTGPNITNYFMSELLPSWKNYPKRSEGVICTTNKKYAKMFATENEDRVYYVFPENGANLGICPENDIWTSFTKNIIGIGREKFVVGRFDTVLLYFFAICNVLAMKDEILCHDIIKNEIDIITNHFKQFDKGYISNCINNCNMIVKKQLYNIEGYDIEHLCEYYFKYMNGIDVINKIYKYGTIVLAIDMILNTDINGFSNIHLNKIIPVFSDNEIWTDSVCLLIKCDDMYSYTKVGEYHA